MEREEGWRESRGGERGGVKRGGVEREEGWRERRGGERGGMEREEGWRERSDGERGGMEREEVRKGDRGEWEGNVGERRGSTAASVFNDTLQAMQLAELSSTVPAHTPQCWRT